MVTIVDYRAGNLTSVSLAFTHLGVPSEITADPDRILAAERVVFPGVGAIAAAMGNIVKLGLVPVLRRVIEKGIPFMGMCLGAQIVLDHSEEDGGVNGLGLIPGKVRCFRPAKKHIKVPHMGWNHVRIIRRHPVLAGIEDRSEFYFVHSYYPAPVNAGAVIGRTRYAGADFAAVMGCRNMFVTQFHPEKSGRIGLHILANFSRWDGKC